MLKMILVIQFYLLVIIGCLVHETAQGGERHSADSGSIRSPERARDLATQYLGIAGDSVSRIQSHGNVSVTVRTFHDSTTPFLSDVIDGNRVWIVDFSDVVFHLNRSTEEFQKLHPKSVSVVLDSAEGYLIRITATTPELENSEFPEVPKDIAERQLQGNEVFRAYESSVPVFSFAEALDSFYGNPLPASKLVGRLIVHSMREEPAIPVWWIQSLGGPAVPFSHGDSLSNVRCIIGAATGKLMLVSDAPKPESGP